MQSSQLNYNIFYKSHWYFVSFLIFLLDNKYKITRLEQEMNVCDMSGNKNIVAISSCKIIKLVNSTHNSRINFCILLFGF